MVKAVAAGLLAVAAIGLVWWSRPAHDSPDAPTSTLAGPPDPTPAPLLPTPPDPPPPAPPSEPSPPPPLDPRLLAEVERHCPWPPDPLSWQVLGAPCLAAMDAIMMDEDWRTALADPLGERRAVGEALDRAECRVPPPVDAEGNLAWPGEVRADLRETCAAGAMVRLAKLQELCIQNVHTDWDLAFSLSRAYDDLWFDENPDMADYHRAVEDNNHGNARTLWRVYRCRSVPPEALEWVDALPLPSAEVSTILSFGLNTNPATITQNDHLYEAARRLGWEFPPGWDDVLRGFAARQLEPDLSPPSVSDDHQFPDNWPRGDRHR